MDRGVRPSRGLGRAGVAVVRALAVVADRADLGAAREQVRVGRRLEDLPQIAEAFAAGRLSYSKVRAITRIAEPEDGVDWVALGRHSSAAQLENVVRGMRRAKANEEAIADPEAAAWSLRTRVRYDDNGNFSYTISGPAELLPMIQAGIEAKRAELQRQRDAEVASAQAEQQEQLPVVEPAEEAEPRSPSGAARAGVPAETSAPVVTSADALVALAQDALTEEQTAYPEAGPSAPPAAQPADRAAVRLGPAVRQGTAPPEQPAHNHEQPARPGRHAAAATGHRR